MNVAHEQLRRTAIAQREQPQRLRAEARAMREFCDVLREHDRAIRERLAALVAARELHTPTRQELRARRGDQRPRPLSVDGLQTAPPRCAPATPGRAAPSARTSAVGGSG
jgi:hypothetical protein